jgi:hypothetical protein
MIEAFDRLVAEIKVSAGSDADAVAAGAVAGSDVWEKTSAGPIANARTAAPVRRRIDVTKR